MQHEFGVSVDEFDQSKKEALVTSSVQFCGFLFELKAGGHLPFERQTLWETTGRTAVSFRSCITAPEDFVNKENPFTQIQGDNYTLTFLPDTTVCIVYEFSQITSKWNTIMFKCIPSFYLI